MVCTAGRISCAELWRAALLHGTAAAQHTWEHSYSSRNCVTAILTVPLSSSQACPPPPASLPATPPVSTVTMMVECTTLQLRCDHSACLPPTARPPARCRRRALLARSFPLSGAMRPGRHSSGPPHNPVLQSAQS